MAAYDYTLPDDIKSVDDKIVLVAGDYRIQDQQITLMTGKEVHITIARINKNTYDIVVMTFIVHDADLAVMSNSITKGLPFRDELDSLIWGWLFANNADTLLLSRSLKTNEILPKVNKV